MQHFLNWPASSRAVSTFTEISGCFQPGQAKVGPGPTPLGSVHSLAREGLGEAQFWRGTYTVVLYIYKYFMIFPHCTGGAATVREMGQQRRLPRDLSWSIGSRPEGRRWPAVPAPGQGVTKPDTCDKEPHTLAQGGKEPFATTRERHKEKTTPMWSVWGK